MPLLPETRAGAGNLNDPRFGDTTATDPALPSSAIRGLVDWHYEVVKGSTFYQLKAGRSVMFSNSRALLPPTGVREGDVFGVLIDPKATVARIELDATAFGGIDEQNRRRYTRATTLLLRWTLLSGALDPDTGDDTRAYGFATIQQTQPNTVIFRGDFSTTAFYIVGDQVNYQGGLYLRTVEGVDGAAGFNAANWIGGGSATPGTPTGEVRDPYDVDAAKRKEVVDANVPAYLEIDSSYYGKEFVDEVYGPGKPAAYRCMPSAPATADGVTVWKWFRFDIL